MTRTTGLSVDVLGSLQKAFEKHTEIEQVKLYGSRAKGTFSERSDIDLVAYGRGIDRFLVADVLLELDDSDIVNMVDMQDYHELKNQQLVEHIDRVGVVIYDKQAICLSEPSRSISG